MNHWKIHLGRVLNRFGANLELCSSCTRFTTWDERRLWGPSMLCPQCDHRLNADLAAMEEQDHTRDRVPHPKEAPGCQPGEGI